MRIDRIESFTRPDVGFVRVTSEDGAFGWGQMSTYHADITAQGAAPAGGPLGNLTVH